MSSAADCDASQHAVAFEESGRIPGFVTTSISIGRAGDDKLAGAMDESLRIGWEFVGRANLLGRISALEMADVLVFEEAGLCLSRYSRGRAINRMRFHPSSSLVRLKSLACGGKDAFIEALGLLPGDSLLDCTMGLGSDSIVASSVVSSAGSVLALEASKAIFEVVDIGMREYSGNGPVEAAISRVGRRHADSGSFWEAVRPKATTSSLWTRCSRNLSRIQRRWTPSGRGRSGECQMQATSKWRLGLLRGVSS